MPSNGSTGVNTRSSLNRFRMVCVDAQQGLGLAYKSPSLFKSNTGCLNWAKQ